MDLDKIKSKMFEAFELIEGIIVVLEKCGFNSKFAEYPKLEEADVNPFYNQISENSPFVVETSGHIPYKVYTPLGYIYIPGHRPAYDRTMLEKLRSTMKDELNLVLFKEKEIHHGDEFGPWYTVGETDSYIRHHQFEYNEARKLFKLYLDEYLNSKGGKQ